MSNRSVNTLPNTEETQYYEIYMTAIQNQAIIAKMNELKSWKKQEVYCEEGIAQSCISVRWVLSRKIKNGENVTKARLCACGFEEIKDFPTDSPCCSRISVRSTFA